MEYVGSTQVDIKLNNQKLILNFLIDHGPSSRADISKQIGSSKPTVSKNVDDLINKGLIIECGKSDNSLGKKGVLLDFNKNYGYVLAIDLSKDKIKMALSNLRYEVQMSKVKSFKEKIKIKNFLEGFMKESNTPVEEIMKIVIAYPGTISKDGTLYLSNAKEKEILLEETIAYITENFNKKPLVMNDINLAIIAEKYEKAYKHYNNLYYMSIDRGVGSGIMIGGKLYEGDRNAAGEIGFMRFLKSDTREYYCLEELITVEAILKRYKDIKGEKITYEEIVEHIAQKEEEALTLYEELVDYISIAMSNVIGVLDIQNVIMAGRVVEVSPKMREDIQKQMDAILHQNIDITISHMENPSLKGGIYMAVKQIVKEI